MYNMIYWNMNFYYGIQMHISKLCSMNLYHRIQMYISAIIYNMNLYHSTQMYKHFKIMKITLWCQSSYHLVNPWIPFYIQDHKSLFFNYWLWALCAGVHYICTLHLLLNSKVLQFLSHRHSIGTRIKILTEIFWGSSISRL
jgi:hypothetical protein